MIILEDFKFDNSYKFENYSGIKEVHCDSRTFLNILSLILLTFAVLLLVFNIILTFMMIKNPPSEFSSWDNEDLFVAIFGFVIFFIPTVLLFLKVFNFKFCINSNNIIYKNWLGRKIICSTADIKRVYLHKHYSRSRYQKIFNY